MKSASLDLTTLALALALLLAGCASQRAAPDDAPTLKTLAGRSVDVPADSGVKAGVADAIDAYRKFLDTGPKAQHRAEAMRRLGDLEMDAADQRLASGSAAAPDFKAAIARYQAYLKEHPKAPGNDRVLYQLARAYEQGGDLEQANRMLDRLVAEYPATSHLEEAQFRRGEILFTMRDYAKAEGAFAAVMRNDQGTFYERSLYMHGWSLFKQGRLEDGLKSFFAVLDRKPALREPEADLAALKDLTRAERELVEDTFRVVSISLQNLQGAASIPAYVTSDARRGYEFRVYQQLGDLYIKQDRTKDAADTFGAFVKQQPLHVQAPQLQARVIDIYQQAGFATLALDAKKDYVSRYGIDSEFRKANPEGWERARPLVKSHLTELARHYHAQAQKTKASADYQEAVRWYRAYIGSFPDDPDTAQNHFLLAELLFEDKRLLEAATEYEKVAYGYPAHAKSADAGYSALLAYVGLEKAASAAELPALQRSSVDSALRFAKAFPADPRSGPVLTNTAEKLFALRDARATDVAQMVLKLDPPAAPEQRRVAWTVLSHSAFDKGAFADAEKGYREVLALTPENDAKQGEMIERLAASVYKQGEQARAAGKLRDAVGHFERVASVAPTSSIRANAQFDAAASLIALKDWDGAIASLEQFRRRNPNHPLVGEAGAKLAVAYMEKGQSAQAAGEFERIAATSKDAKLAQSSLWQAAELYEKGGSRTAAARAYERYLKQYPESFETGIEVRYRLARMASADGHHARELALMKEIHQADLAGGARRTDRTRYLGATASLALAEPAAEAYRKVALVEPLAKNLKLKKARMEAVLKAYAAAADYGVADVTTAATYHTAALYQDFGKAMLNSQRPRKLNKAELEQYNVMLEEQAFPFEEKATELHEVNVKRAAAGIYDKWVQQSFKSLAALRPVRYGKLERSESVIDAIR
ncbi:MAG: tetratricopeptide repeat protein [Ideonella sp.]|nr:tetratricopeptide repeat protein [Ideonella sp.]MCC7458952.1 tetratricopeptide repeat protein [Nitrospira sp.]